MRNVPEQNTPTSGEAICLADMVAEHHGRSFSQSMPRQAVIQFLVLAGLFVVFNYWQFKGLVRAWLDDPNWSHGFAIPLFSLYLIYSRWQELLDARRRICIWGLPVVILSILVVVFGFFPIGTAMVSQWGMVLLMFGLVLYLNGPTIARLTWLPIAYMVFAIPIPDIVYSQIAEPLQSLAASGAGVFLRVIGVQGVAISESNIAFRSVSGAACNLTVAEACAGMRMLMAFVALGVAMAYLGDRPIWQRVVLVAAAVPIAVLSNLLRVAITCSAYLLDHPEFGQDFMHTFTGILVLIPALLFLLLLDLLLRSLFVEVDDDDQPASPLQGPTTGANGEAPA